MYYFYGLLYKQGFIQLRWYRCHSREMGLGSPALGGVMAGTAAATIIPATIEAIK
jgi:hypothetical protein